MLTLPRHMVRALLSALARLCLNGSLPLPIRRSVAMSWPSGPFTGGHVTPFVARGVRGEWLYTSGATADAGVELLTRPVKLKPLKEVLGKLIFQIKK